MSSRVSGGRRRSAAVAALAGRASVAGATRASVATAVAARRSRFARLGHALGRGDAGVTFGQRQDFPPTQTDLAVAVDAEDLDLDLVAVLQHVLHAIDTVVRDLGDVQEP